MSRILAAVLAAGLTGLVGCGGGAADGQSTDTAESPGRLSGVYHLVISQSAGPQGYVDIYAGRVKFPDKGEIELEHATEAFPAAKLVESKIEGGQVRLAFDSQGDKVDFEGRIGRDGALGSFSIGGLQCTPARLIPPAQSDFDDENMVSRSAGSSELLKLQQAGADFTDLLGFCQRNPNSPAIVNVYGELMPYLSQMDYTEEQVREFAQTYEKAAARWGERMRYIARANVGYGLAVTEHFPKLGLEYLRDAEQKLAPSQAEGVRGLISQAEEVVQRAEAREQIAAGNLDQAIETLEPLRKKRAFDPVVTWLLARATEKSNQTDKALALYGELVALPRLETYLVNSPAWDDKDEQPADALERLWEAAHGGTDGLSTFVDQVYVKAVEQVAALGETPVPAENGSRAVLAELFTGAACDPCVAADLGAMALEATYPRTDLLVLRYHQHSPAEDPLANEHGERRFDYYTTAGEPRGTPTFVVNGERLRNIGGFLPMAPMAYELLRKSIDPLVAQESKYAIEVSALEQDDNLTLHASVTGGELPKDLRLRLALAEDDLSYQARNGVRKHRLIVRHMPGGPDGIAPADGKLVFDGTVAREELRRGLLSYLTKKEREFDVRFPVKPVELKPLYLVAFLQNDRTKEILQAAGVAVGGEAVNGLPADEPAESAVDGSATESQESGTTP